MNKIRVKKTGFILVPLMLVGSLKAATTLNITGYSINFNNTSTSAYEDNGGAQLNDNLEQNIVWGGGESISFDDVRPLVGWQLVDPLITLDFGTTVTIGGIQVWAADSNGVAGVHFPDRVTISDPNSSFSRSLNLTDPAGGGSMVAINLSGFSVTTDTLEVSVSRGGTWTFLSEVNAFAVPEPSSVILFGIAIPCLFMQRKRNRVR